MAEANSTQRTKPAKPYPGFPLFPHKNGQWCKKRKGKFYYFGPWENPDAALDLWLEQRDNIMRGRVTTVARDALTLGRLCNQFLADRQKRVDAGELSERSFRDYQRTCEQIVAAFGPKQSVDELAPEDFSELRAKLATNWGPTTLGNAIQRIRTLFKFAFDSQLVKAPIQFGPSFVKPSKRTMRLHRLERGIQMFEPDEIHRLLDVACDQMKAMILLGCNLGFGNRDCATLPVQAIDLKGGWYDYFRQKNAVKRRGKLWDETVAALSVVVENSRNPKNSENKDLVFLTRFGNPWLQFKTNSIALVFTKLAKKAGIERSGRSFYSLRHTFRTVADAAKDPPAINLAMGHVTASIDEVYRERIDDSRLEDIAAITHKWLFESEV